MPSFGLAFLVGEGLVSAFGYEVGGDQPPWPVLVASTVPALVVFVLPALATIHFGRQGFVLTNLLAPLLGG